MGPISCDSGPLHCSVIHSKSFLNCRNYRHNSNLMWMCVFSGVWWSCHCPLSGPHGGLHSGQRPQQPLGCHRSHHHTAYLEGQEDHWWWGWESLGWMHPVSCPLLLSGQGDRSCSVPSAEQDLFIERSSATFNLEVPVFSLFFTKNNDRASCVRTEHLFSNINALF